MGLYMFGLASCYRVPGVRGRVSLTPGGWYLNEAGAALRDNDLARLRWDGYEAGGYSVRP